MINHWRFAWFRTDLDRGGIGTCVQSSGYSPRSKEYFGRLNIVLNNADHPLIDTTEDGSIDDTHNLYKNNVIGPVNVIQAAMPRI